MTLMIAWIVPSCACRCSSNSPILAASSLSAARASRRWTKARTTKNAHFYSLFRVEHRCCHDCAMFGEGIGQRAPATTANVCGRKLRPQRSVLSGRKLEHKIRWESSAVALYLFIQALYRCIVEVRQRCIENDPLVTQDQDSEIDRDRSRLSSDRK
jgi:hypothetical protein